MPELAPDRCLYCDGTDPNCGFCNMGVPLDTQEDWDRTWGRVLNPPAHEVTAVPVEKLRDGIIGYRFACSCGRTGNGWHNTPEQAVAAGQNHIR